MKTKFKSIRLLLATVALGALASFAYAGPGLQHWQTLGQESQFKELKIGDKVAFVCNQCKTVSEVTIESSAQAMDFCKEGATVVCPSCKMQTKVVLKGQRNDPPSHTVVTYVNDKGEECAFIAKVADKK